MFKKKLNLLLGGVLLSSGAMANTHNFDLGFQDDLLLLDLGTQFERSDVHLSVQYYDKVDEGHLASISLLKTHDINIHHIELGVRPVKLWSDQQTSSGHAISVGGLYSINIVHNISLSLSGYYAPKVLSYSDVEGYSQFDTRINYEVIPNFKIYTGYNKIKFAYEDDNKQTHHHKYDGSMFAGVGLKF